MDDEARTGKSPDPGLIVAVATMIFLPYVPRLAWPSLYVDDVVRVAFRQTESLSQSLFRPFNEHLAPLFEVVGWAAWRSAGERLTDVPLAFTTASYVPFLLCLHALYRVGRVEGLDLAAALGALAVFALSDLSNEIVFWYSASSFAWALAFVLYAWSEAIRSAREESVLRSRAHAAAAAAFAFLAPCSCALGILAGPIAVLRGLLDGRRRLQALTPALGTAAYVFMAAIARHRGVVARSVENGLELREGFVCLTKAFVGKLVPGVVGLDATGGRLSTVAALVLFFVAATALAVWSIRSRRTAALLATSFALIFAGYGLIYPFRIAGDPAWVLTVQRYHLFPQAGLALIAGAAFSAATSRLCRTRALVAAAALTLALLMIHTPGIKRHARFYRYPEQSRTLSAMERLSNRAAADGVSRERLIDELDPVRNAWLPDPKLFNAWRLLPPKTTEVRPIGDLRRWIESWAAVEDQEALFGGMDVARRASTLDSLPSDAVPGRIVIESRVRREGESGYESLGPMAFVEIEWDPSDRPSTALCWETTEQGEIWWPDAAGNWSPSRSFTWSDPARGRFTRLRLDQLPHWVRVAKPRLRVLIRDRRPKPIRPPLLVR